eukprot:COSAG04_NODE_2585_length_3892_cov_19.578961_5_plen_350_part_01
MRRSSSSAASSSPASRSRASSTRCSSSTAARLPLRPRASLQLGSRYAHLNSSNRLRHQRSAPSSPAVAARHRQPLRLGLRLRGAARISPPLGRCSGVLVPGITASHQPRLPAHDLRDILRRCQRHRQQHVRGGSLRGDDSTGPDSVSPSSRSRSSSSQQLESSPASTLCSVFAYALRQRRQRRLPAHGLRNILRRCQRHRQQHVRGGSLRGDGSTGPDSRLGADGPAGLPVFECPIRLISTAQIVSGIDDLLRLRPRSAPAGGSGSSPAACAARSSRERRRALVSSVLVPGIAASHQQRLPAHGLRDILRRCQRHRQQHVRGGSLRGDGSTGPDSRLGADGPAGLPVFEC